MGGEDFLGSLLGELLVEEEITIWVAALTTASLSFEGIGSNH